MAHPSRVTSVVLLAGSTALLLVSLVVPWWEFERREGRGWEEYMPFSADEGAAEGEFSSETRTLGFLVAFSFPLSVVSLVFAAVRLGRPSRRATPIIVSGALAMAFVAGALLFVVLAFPAEAREVKGEGYESLSFQGRDCTASDVGGQSVESCARTRASRGWYAGLVGGIVLPIAGWITGSVGQAGPRPPRERPAPAPVLPPPEEPAKKVVASVPERVVGAGGYRELGQARTAYVKCPQCQTRLAFTRGARGPTVVKCHNCGKRLRA